ncbi:MAG: 5'-nucleotidase, lipoprotein e(P4) family [Pyrinomonadaceae bacterium]
MNMKLSWFRSKNLALALMLMFGGYTAGTWSGASSAQAPQTAVQPNYDHLLNAVLFMQTSAEYRALTYQAFNVARMSLDRDLRHKTRDRRRRAVVVDVDETVLDNSPYQGWQILNHRNFEQASWAKWTGSGAAQAIPGAVDFLKYATSRGVRVFYITNRAKEELPGTLANLRKAGFPDISEETVLLRDQVSSKEPRRAEVRKKHRIVLLVGDNLNDIAQVFERKPIAERFAAVDENRTRWGTEYIVIPNAMYGEWENAVYEYTPGLNAAGRMEKRLSHLQTFTP